LIFNPIKTITDVDIASFTDGGDNKDIVSAIFAIEPVQSGSGDPSPDNERPITGWTEANISCADGYTDITSRFINGVAAIDTSSIQTGGQLASKRLVDTGYIPIYPNRFIRLESVSNTSTDIQIAVQTYPYNEARDDNARINDTGWSDSPLVVTNTGDTVVYTRVLLRYSTDDDTNISPSNVASLSYCSGKVINVDWTDSAGTIYKGTLTYNGDGTWTPTATVAQILGNTLAWSVTTSGDDILRFFAQLPDTIKNIASWNGINVMCNRYKIGTVPASGSGDDYTLGIYGNVVAVKDTSYSTLADFAADGSTLQIVAELTTPIVGTTITTDEFTTLLGDNNIWCDTGKVSQLNYIMHYIILKGVSRMRKGGYVMIDCKGLDLTGGSTPQVLTGLHSRIADAFATEKLILLNNCRRGSGVFVSPIPVIVNASSTSYVLYNGTLAITVTNADSATVADLTSANRTVATVASRVASISEVAEVSEVSEEVEAEAEAEEAETEEETE